MHKAFRVSVFFQKLLICFLLLFSSTAYAAGPTNVGGTYSSNQTWTPDGSPYIVTSDISLINCATLTITTALTGGGEAPVIIKFNPGKGMRIGRNFSNKEYGFLIAQGSDKYPITFTTNVVGQYWKGISFMWLPPAGQCAGLYNKLSHCVIEHGAAPDSYNENGKANVINRCSYVLIEYCTIYNSLHNGFYFASGDTIHAGGLISNCIITNNQEMGISLEAQSGSSVTGVCSPVIQNCEISRNGTYGLYCSGYNCNPDIGAGNRFVENGSYPLRVFAIMRIAADNTFSDNGQQAIEVIGRTIFENMTWHNFGIPYLVREKDITIPDSAGKTLTLTIEPGTTVKFSPGLGLNLGGGTTYQKRWGILNAQGTKAHPVVLTAISPGQYWDGITFTWSPSAENSRLDYCTVEYAGEHKEQYATTQLDAALVFNECVPSASTLQHSIIRYSKSDGLSLYGQNAGSVVIRTCNFYGNALYDIIDQHNKKTVSAELNFWGTPNGPGDDFCSSAVVSSNVRYEPWLEEEFTEPLRVTSASASPKQFEPLTGHTTISFALSQAATWTLSIINQQLETLWSKTGTSAGDAVIWNGTGTGGGVVSGLCFYRIEAENSSGLAAPVRGMLMLGNQTVARINQPVSGSLFAPGSKIIIAGTAQPGAGQYYEVQYGSGENPASWVSISGPVYSSRLNAELAAWDTTGIDQPVATVRLEVHTAAAVYTDIVRVGFFIAGNQEPANNAVTYRYDALGRLIAALYPDGSAITYTYDRVGNRLAVNKTGQAPPTAVKVSRFSATPTQKGVIIQWETETENRTAGFNLYRKSAVQGDYQKINTSLIPAQGSATTGARYSYTDVPPRPGNRWQYLLEEVETGGATNRYGPAAAVNRSLRVMSGAGAFRKTLKTNCD
jgi:YD repeat-containing protein